jgi:hypothetical protein
MVNTFLLYVGSDFKKTSDELDSKRKFKQLLEARQIIVKIETKNLGHHPCVHMWKNNLKSLKYYYNCFYESLLSDGVDLSKFEKYKIHGPIINPWFVSFEPFVFANRNMLKKKNPIYYREYTYPKEYENKGYFWPRKSKQEYSEFICEDGNYDTSMCDDLNKKYINPRYCSAVIKTGINKGKECGILLDGTEYCGIHKNYSK